MQTAQFVVEQQTSLPPAELGVPPVGFGVKLTTIASVSESDSRSTVSCIGPMSSRPLTAKDRLIRMPCGVLLLSLMARPTECCLWCATQCTHEYVCLLVLTLTHDMLRIILYGQVRVDLMNPAILTTPGATFFGPASDWVIASACKTCKTKLKWLCTCLVSTLSC